MPFSFNGMMRGVMPVALLVSFSSTATVELNPAESSLTQTITTSTNQFDSVSQQIRTTNRYIVELQSDSVLARQQDLGLQNSETERAIIALQQQQLIQQLQHIDAKIEVKQQFNLVLNAIAIHTDESNLTALRSLNNVKRVVADEILSKSLSESVPLIEAPTLWDTTLDDGLSVTGHGVTVAILDTGIDYTHSALGGCLGDECKVTHGYDFHYDDTDPMDVDGHGTHVAGIVAANSNALKGVAPDATLHAYKVLGDEGFGYTSSSIAGIERAMDPDQDGLTDDHVDVINMSLSGGGGADSLLSQAVDRATAAGVIVVVSAGNGGSYNDIANTSPASAATAITVASTTKSDSLSGFSSKADSQFGAWLKPEIAAPGSDILSAALNDGVAYLSGTSMAAPHVAGAAALLRQYFPESSSLSIKQRLMATALDLGSNPHAQGAGRVALAGTLSQQIASVEGIVDFGNIAQDSGTFSAELSLTLVNLTDQDITLQTQIQRRFPESMSLSFPATVELGALDETQITIQLNIDDTSALNAAGMSNLTFIETLEFYADNLALTVPVTVQRAYELELSHDAPGEAMMWLYGNGDSAQILNVYEGQPETVKVAAGDYHVITSYFVLSPDLVPFNLPVDDAVITGLSVAELNIASNTEYESKLADLRYTMGVGEVLNESDQPLPRAQYNNLNTSIEIHLPEQLYSSLTFNPSKNPYYVVSALPPSTSLAVGTALIAEREEQVLSVYFPYKKVTSDELDNVLFDWDMSHRQAKTISAPSPLAEQINQVSLSVFGPNSGGSNENYNDVNQVNLYLPDLDARRGKLDISFRHKTSEQQYNGNVVITPEVFNIDQNGQFVRNSFNFRHLTRPGSDEMWLTGEATYWHHPMIIRDGILISEWDGNWPIYSEYITLRDAHGNAYGDAVEIWVNSYCDNQLTSSSLYDISMTFDFNLDCDVITGEILFPTYLAGETVDSSLTFVVKEQAVQQMQTIREMAVVFNGEPQAHAAINRLDSQLLVGVNNHLLGELSAEIKLGDSQQWTPLNVADIRYNDDHVLFDLPMEFGEHVASLRITVGDYSQQTLNHFTTHGSDAGYANDVDNDGIPNQDDLDNDNDGVNDNEDAFPLDNSEWLDTDGDGIGNNADPDDDNDGVDDTNDAFPLDPTESVDTDGDGIGNNADDDDDNDGVNDANDAFPLDASESVDTDGDGIGNNADNDDDNDGVADANDAFPLDASESVDTDGDGIGNNADNDDDNDGVNDANDAFPLDPNRSARPVTPPKKDAGSSGGSVFWLALMLGIAVCRRRYQYSR